MLILLPGESVRTYIRTYSDVISKFSRMDSLTFSLKYGAPRSRTQSPPGGCAIIIIIIVIIIIIIYLIVFLCICPIDLLQS